MNGNDRSSFFSDSTFFSYTSSVERSFINVTPQTGDYLLIIENENQDTLVGLLRNNDLYFNVTDNQSNTLTLSLEPNGSLEKYTS